MAQTPSPLPIPAQAPPVNPLADALTALGRAAPNIDPEVATAVAQTSSSPGQAAETGQAAAGYTTAVNTANYLRQQNTTNQQAAWNQLTAGEQKMVQAAGYRPPHPGRSLWGTVTHSLGRAASDTLNAVGSPLRAVQHGVRATFAVLNHPGDPMGGSTDFGRFLSPGEWANGWNETSNGTKYILPQVEQKVLSRYGQNTYDLAHKLATGTSAAQMVAAAPAAQQQQLAQQLAGDPNLQKAVTELQAGHVSEGRMLAYRVLGLKAGSRAGQLLSGATDAAIDWFADPVVLATKAEKVYTAAKYLVRDGNDVQRLFQSRPAVQQAFARMAGHVDAGNYTGLVQDFPKLGPMVDTFRDWHPTTASEVADMFADNRNAQALIAGYAASVPGLVEGGTLPHLSRAGMLRLAAKGQLQKAIDWAADRPATIEGLQPGDTIDHVMTAEGKGTATRIVTATGKMVRQLTTLTPKGNEFDANDPNWFSKLQNIAKIALPAGRANNLLNRYAAESTLGGRRLIYAGLLKEVISSMGIDRIPDVTDWINSVTGEHADAVFSHQSYAPGDIDRVYRAGQPAASGILRSHMVDTWAMPNFKTLYTQSKKLGVMRAVDGSLNNQMVDTFMNEIWKPLALARFGFAVRVAGEEAFGMLLRASPTAYLRARAAGTMAYHEARAADPEQYGRLASTWGWLTDHLPSAAKARIQTPSDLVVEHMSDATQRAMANVAGVFAGQKYRAAVRLMADNGVLSPDGAFGRYVSASEAHGGAFYDQAIGELKGRAWNHGRMAPIRLSRTGAYVDYKTTAQLFTNFWFKHLNDIAVDPWARAALEARNLPAADRLNHVAGVLAADPAWSRAERSLVTTDGRYVGEDANSYETAIDHAKAVTELVDAVTRDADGVEIPGLADHLLANRKSPTAAALDLIDEDSRPAAVTGPETIPVDGKATAMWQTGINRMFSIVGRQIDWMSRQPMFVHNFTASLDAYDKLAGTWRQMGMSEQDVQQALVRAATDRAIKMTTPFIHDPQIRSQFEVITRNMMPFMFAQEQFYKRWAKTMAWSPWAFRQAQLINQGVYHSGFTHTDPTSGQQYFVYPGASVVQDVLTHALGAFGYSAWLPIEANLRGQVKMASPGLERLGLPSFGPAVVIPMKLVQQVFPESRGPAQAIEGQQTASAGFLTSLVPTTVSRVWQDFTQTPNNSEQFASAMMQAIQYLEASGHGIGTVAVNNLGAYAGTGPPAWHGAQYKPGDYTTDQHGRVYVMQGDGQWRPNDPASQQSYMQRVKNWTRIFLVTRTLFGFNAPASPEALFDPSHVNEDFQALLKELPYNEAVAAFMQLHPDASAYTVFQTKNEAGDYLPATASAMQFMDANGAFFQGHPLAGAFFIPTQDQSGKYDRQAYQNQLTEQLRVRRTPKEFWQEIAYTNAATPYFQAETKKNAALAGGANSNEVNREWTSESQQYMKANPLFAQQLADSGSTYTRADIEQDLASALNDPALPETAQTEDIRQLFNAWTLYQAMTAPYSSPSGGTLSSQQRYQIELTFAQEATQFLSSHPDAQPVFDRLMKPDLSAAMNAMATAGVAA